MKGWDESLQAPKGCPEDLARTCRACHATCPSTNLDNLDLKDRHRLAHPRTKEFGGKWGGGGGWQTDISVSWAPDVVPYLLERVPMYGP